MARKKEPGLVDINQKRISEVAKNLFHSNGITSTKMDDIAAAAGMSKSTLYVYFKSKEDIENYLSLESMHVFYEGITDIFDSETDNYRAFMSVCMFLANFKDKFPIGYEMLFRKISVDDIQMEKKPYLLDIYNTGEKINKSISDYFSHAMSERTMDEAESLIFTIWGSICGIITLADNKKEYIKKNMKISQKEFLKRSFDKLFMLIK